MSDFSFLVIHKIIGWVISDGQLTMRHPLCFVFVEIISSNSKTRENEDRIEETRWEKMKTRETKNKIITDAIDQLLNEELQIFKGQKF